MKPPALNLVPIDDDARNGRHQLVFAQDRYALVRWIGGHWIFPSGQALPDEPTHYHRKD